MNLKMSSNYQNITDKKLQEKIFDLNSMYLNECMKGNKVAFYYEDINTGTVVSFNEDICFYAASSIKILVCLLLLEKAQKNEIDLNSSILVRMSDLKQDTGIIKHQKEDTKYTILELIKLTITESDNTAYLKLVDLVGKDNLEEYGKSLGATHTMEGKDCFGIINCKDMIIYWKKVKDFIDKQTNLGNLFKSYLLNPSVKLVADSTIEERPFVRKYGSWDIAYHEAGYVEDDSNYYMIILTQINKMPYKEEFMNESAKKILELHKTINEKTVTRKK